MAVRLLAFAGSTRSGSRNQMLLDLATESARAQGAEVTPIRLRDFPLPLFDADLEQGGFPAEALELKQLFHAHQGFLVASPEYNGSVTGVLKNAIDWVSRPRPGEAYLGAFAGKVAGLMSASIGPFGGLRSLTHLRQILATIQTLVVGPQVLIPYCEDAFEAGRLRDERLQDLLDAEAAAVIDLAGRRGGHHSVP